MKRELSKVAADFLTLKAHLPRAAASSDFPREDGSDPREVLSRAYAALEGARVFDIEPSTWGAIYHEADVYTHEVIAQGGPWTPARQDGTFGDPPAGFADWAAWNEHYLNALGNAGRDLPFPEKLPFPATYIGFDGVALSQVQMGWRGLVDGETIAAELHGYAIRDSGEVFEYFRLFRRSGEAAVGALPIRDPSGALVRFTMGGPAAAGARGPWYGTSALTPWVVTALVDLVNSYRTFAVQDTSVFYRTEYAARGKREHGMRRAVPPPFYTIRLRDELVRETGTTQAWRKAAKLRHRFDVRGHERIRVARGTMPLDEKLRRKLEKRKYRIFTVEPLDQDTWRMLAERRLAPKRPDEWLAIRKCWVRSFEKGPEGAPFIPAVRRVPRRRRATTFQLEGG